MNNSFLHYATLFVVLTMAQIICSKMVLFNVATPIIFVFLILRLPTSFSQNKLLTLAFFMGLLIDIFNNTQGMNALSCTVFAALRRPVLNVFVARDDDLNPIPSSEMLGTEIYLKYMSTMVLIYCTLLFSIQAFTLYNFWLTLARILASSVLSILLIFGIDTLLSSTSREKRL